MEHDPYYNISADGQLEVYAEINSNASNPALHDSGSDFANIKSSEHYYKISQVADFFFSKSSFGDAKGYARRGLSEARLTEARAHALVPQWGTKNIDNSTDKLLSII